MEKSLKLKNYWTGFHLFFGVFFKFPFDLQLQSCVYSLKLVPLREQTKIMIIMFKLNTDHKNFQ